MTFSPPAPGRASRGELLRLRRLAQAIDGPREPDPAAAARRLLALQGQDFAAGCWALALRTTGATQADVLAELDAGRIIRSWPMRGTLHFVPPEDLRWMLSVTADRMVAGLGRRQQQLGLEAADFAHAADVVTAALTGGNSIGRAELMQLWEDAGIATTGQRGYHLIYYLAQTGLLCWGPVVRVGNGNPTQALVLLDEWAPAPPPLSADEALAQFLLRYLHGHGPATVRDFVWWTKGTVAGAKTARAVLGDALTTLEVDGVEYLVTAELLERAAATPASRAEKEAVHLLPGFDEYLLGYQDRSPILDDEHAELIVPGGNGIFQPIIVAGGRIVGTWRRDGGRVLPQPFAPLTPAREARLERSARAYAAYAG
ncbi:winged helix DNA-binding domain-containing protein [Leifsonia sp. fls2-241-R2A-40a]|uniref:winged helix DNA-binding domain-containing protein n=1 Tax=Leifsonia sp. fls2-241-R2A-40a TaxID=3040290 RepID=UPI0025506361|nr:winged helix DNA-binding domain-containing protein [Leifsonia sp. fls2-241-R2A-40a]